MVWLYGMQSFYFCLVQVISLKSFWEARLSQRYGNFPAVKEEWSSGSETEILRTFWFMSTMGREVFLP